MSEMVARTGRHQQRYEDGRRLVAGCIPFKYRDSDGSGDANSGMIVEGGWENDETVEEAARREAFEEAGVRGDIKEFLGHYHFRSRSHQDEFSPDGLCKAAMFALFVKEELNSWPEQSTRTRQWLTIPEASKNCRHAWMREVLDKGFLKWHVVDTTRPEEEDDRRVLAIASPHEQQ
ncbi:hypothetical protein Sjap_002118 [Stephania japonica]|uniref:Nudix hydrolase domain-containing protein n=1 Tax=Stephania japonica TaxID=461633 RepID=A0AAP0KMV5_9MAGN